MRKTTLSFRIAAALMRYDELPERFGAGDVMKMLGPNIHGEGPCGRPSGSTASFADTLFALMQLVGPPRGLLRSRWTYYPPAGGEVSITEQDALWTAADDRPPDLRDVEVTEGWEQRVFMHFEVTEYWHMFRKETIS